MQPSREKKLLVVVLGEVFVADWAFALARFVASNDALHTEYVLAANEDSVSATRVANRAIEQLLCKTH
jgi:hypothetical protein